MSLSDDVWKTKHLLTLMKNLKQLNSPLLKPLDHETIQATFFSKEGAETRASYLKWYLCLINPELENNFSESLNKKIEQLLEYVQGLGCYSVSPAKFMANHNLTDTSYCRFWNDLFYYANNKVDYENDSHILSPSDSLIEKLQLNQFSSAPHSLLPTNVKKLNQSPERETIKTLENRIIQCRESLKNQSSSELPFAEKQSLQECVAETEQTYDFFQTAYNSQVKPFLKCSNYSQNESTPNIEGINDNLAATVEGLKYFSELKLSEDV